MMATSEQMKKYWASLGPEAKKIRLGKFSDYSLCSEEQRQKRRDIATENLRLGRENMSEEEKLRRNEKAGKSISAQIASLSLEERKGRCRNSFLSDEAIKRSCESRRISRRLHPEYELERIRRSFEANRKRPTEPELFLSWYLDKHLPGEWSYNGMGNGGIIIGGRIPDFIHMNGEKSVIEVFDTYWHDGSEVVEREKHYKKFGFSCLVLWSMNAIFGVTWK